MCMEAKTSFQELLASISTFHASLYRITRYHSTLDFFGYILLIRAKGTVRIGQLPKTYTYTLPSMCHSTSIRSSYKHGLFLQLEDAEITWEQQQRICIEKNKLPGEDSYNSAGLDKQDKGSQWSTPEWAKQHPFLSDKWNSENRGGVTVQKCVQ